MNERQPYELSEPDDSLIKGENEDIREDIIEVLGKDWLTTKNVLFGNRTPEELVGTKEEIRIRNILRQYVVAAFS